MEDIRSISKKKKFVADGVFKAEVHEFFERALVGAGYAGISIKNTVKRIIITVRVVNKQTALGPNGVRGNEFESLIEKRFGFKQGHVIIHFDPVRNKNLCASAQAEYLKAKLLQGASVRPASMYIIRSVLRVKGVKGCEVIISGKLRQQRAKVVKYKDGYLISTGEPKNQYIDHAIRHIFFKQGIIGIQIKIMLPTDPTGREGPVNCLPDKITIFDPKEDDEEPIYELGDNEETTE